jgi:hypothetical protein
VWTNLRSNFVRNLQPTLRDRYVQKIGDLLYADTKLMCVVVASSVYQGVQTLNSEHPSDVDVVGTHCVFVIPIGAVNAGEHHLIL